MLKVNQLHGFWARNPTDQLLGWDPFRTGAAIALSNNNLTATKVSDPGNEFITQCTKGIPHTDAGYFEVYIVASGGSVFSMNLQVGVAHNSISLGPVVAVGTTAVGWGYDMGTGWKQNNSNFVVFGSPYGSTSVIGVAVDNGDLWWSLNDVWQDSGDPATHTNPAYSGLTGTLFPSASLGRSDAPAHEVIGRFVAADMTGTIPAGFPAWEVA